MQPPHIIDKFKCSKLKTKREMKMNIAARRKTGWPKKVSHYRESSLNRIKNRKPG